MTPVTINGRRYDIDLPADTPLLWALRDELGLTGTKFGCGMALCGACTVHLDGQAVRSCMTPLSAVANKKVTTIEGLEADTGRQGGPDGLDRGERAAVRLLPVGPDHVGHGPLEAHPEAHRCRHRQRHGREHLPVRDLPPHSHRNQAGGGPAGSEVMIATPGRNADPERDRAAAPPVVIANVSRRRFLQGVSALGGFVLAVGYSRASRADDPPKYGADGMPHGWVDNPLAFVAIADDGTVTIVCHRSEMGQGVRTGMPMIVAEELEADWKRVKVAQAPGDEEKYGNQDTDGSRSTRHFFDPMRRCGAAARAMLEAAAAAQWKVPVTEVEAKNHEVVHKPTGRKLGYGALAKAAAQQPVPARETLRLKDPSQFRYIGKGQLKLVDARDIATGKAQYGQDTRLDGMLYAVVARPPVYGGQVASFDDTDALKVPGVVKRGGDRGHPRPARLQPAGRHRGHREEYLGGHAGPEGAEGRLGRRPERGLRLRGVQGDARGGRAAAGAGGPQRRRRRRGHGRRRQEDRGGVLHPPSRARDHGAAGGRRPHRSGEVRGVGLLPVPPGHARPGREAARHGHEGRDRPRDAARRRVRAQVQARLRDRGGGAVPGDGREAGEGRLDPRGRPPSLLLPHGLRGAPRGGRGRARQAGGVAPPDRRTDDHVDLRAPTRSRRRTGSSGWA